MTDLAIRRDDISTMELGRVLSQSGYFSDAREAAQAVVKVLAGRELGIGPVASMTGIYIVKGRVTLSAALIGAAIKRSGRYNYRVLRLDDQACEIVFFEQGVDIGHSEFTIADAKTANLLTNETYKRFPRNMLLARALSNGARWYCPDVFSGPIYTPDELGEPVNEDGEVENPRPVVVTVVERPALVEISAGPVNPSTGELAPLPPARQPAATPPGVMEEADLPDPTAAIFDINAELVPRGDESQRQDLVTSILEAQQAIKEDGGRPAAFNEAIASRMTLDALQKVYESTVTDIKRRQERKTYASR